MNLIALPVPAHQPTMADLMSISRSLVIHVRRNIRKLAASNALEQQSARQLRRTAKHMKDRANPFDAARIADLTRRADILVERCRERTAAMKENAALLMKMAPNIDAVTTLADRCELLNINRADRGGLTEGDGVVELIHVHGLEDSATYRGLDFKAGPMNHAMALVLIDFLCESPEGRKLGDSLFEPGGLLEGLPMYQQGPDGNLERLPPRLRLVR